MTIKLRERLFWGFFAASTLEVIGTVTLVWLVGPGVIARIVPDIAGTTPATVYLELGTAGLCGLYAMIVSGIVALRSGKTVSLEIFFFAFWAFCQSFELVKFVSVILLAQGAGSGSFELATRVALFGRYGATMALFAGSLFSSGLKSERGTPLFLAILLAALFFATVHPLNSIGPGADLLADRGAMPLAQTFQAALVILAAIDYALAWYSSKDRAYLVSAAGMILCVVSIAVVQRSTHVVALAAVVPLLVIGTIAYIRSMHAYYLWR